MPSVPHAVAIPSPDCYGDYEPTPEDWQEFAAWLAETETETVPDVYPDECPELPDSAYFDPDDEDWGAIRDGSADEDIIDEIVLRTVSEFQYQMIQAELDERYNAI